MNLYICEKPSQGRDLAKNLNCTKHSEGFLSNNDTIVTWCLGHLLELCEPNEYDPKYQKWNIDDLPIIPEKFKYNVRKDAAKQYKIVSTLVKQASTVFIATDYDREGEAIARNILERCKFKGIIKRVCLRALDDASIKQALLPENIKEGSETEPLYQSALARSRADWIVGMNLSRLFSILGRNQGLTSSIPIGRVQTPTVALVVKRDREIAQFKPIPYYSLKVAFSTDMGNFIAEWMVPEELSDENGRCLKKDLAINVANLVINKIGNAIKADHKTENEQPPLPYDLTSLQQFASKRWGYTAQQTLDLVQSLYEKHKYTTYPRTDCRHLPLSQFSDAQNIINNISEGIKNLEQYKNLFNLEKKPKSFVSKIDSAHHAIIPTSVKPNLNNLTIEERNVYMAILCNYLIQFCDNARYNKSSIIMEVEGQKFSATSKSLIDKGYLQILELLGLKKISEELEDQNENTEQLTNKLPLLQLGASGTVINTSIEDKETTPPSHFTEATLLVAMEHIAKYVDDERFKKILKETDGIGTPATRASIIETAIKHNYLERNKKLILATNKSMNLIDLLPAGIRSAGLTAAWEQTLEKISKKEEDLNVFMEKINRWIISLIKKYNTTNSSFTITNEIKNSLISNNNSSNETKPHLKSRKKTAKGTTKYKKKEQNQKTTETYKINETNESILCPLCGSPMILRKNKKNNNTFFGCSKYPNCNGIKKS